MSTSGKEPKTGVDLVRVIVADEHAIFRVALQGLLDDDPAFAVVGEAADGDTAVELAHALQPDIVLVDAGIPGPDPLTVLQRIHEASVATKTIVLASEIDSARVVDVLRTGARGILMKDAPIDTLFKGVHAVVAGEYWVGRERVGDLLAFLRTGQRTSDTSRRYGLTPREMEIVRAVVAGWTNREISERLSISPNTAKHHLSNVFDKLGVSNRLELALFAHHHALLDEPIDRLKVAV